MGKNSKNFYRRHRRDCEGGHPEESFSGEFEERKKGWKRCNCPISVSGTIQRKFKRKSLGVGDWEVARALVADLADWAEIAPPPSQPAPVLAEAAQPTRVLIQHAVDGFLRSHANSAMNTHQKYLYLLRDLKRFSESHGYVFLDQWTTADVREFRDSWQVSVSTSRAKLAWCRTFFNYCVSEMEWLTQNPVPRSKRRRTRAEQEEKERIPFTDHEVERMYMACRGEYNKTKSRPLIWKGEDLEDFISISVYTGLRISDVAKFHIERLKPGGDVHIRTTKNGRKVYTWVPEWLEERIRIRAMKFGSFIFGVQHTDNLNIVTKTWRDRLKRLWKLCGPWKETPVPHRFRHTFARILLQNGVGITPVADLLGDTEPVVRKHYAAWVEERQDRLRKILQDAFEDKPMPDKVVAFPKKG